MPHRILYFGLNPTHYPLVSQITHFPLIEVVPRASNDLKIIDALSRFNEYSHVLITSKSALPLLKNLLPVFNFSMKDWTLKETWAIGEVTAKHLKELSIVPSYIAKEETSEGIIKELPLDELKDKHLFWPHSSLSRKIIPNFLTKQRIQFTECSLYDTVPIKHRHYPNLEDFEELIFTSPSTVDAFLLHYESLPSHKILTPIGPVTANYLNKFLPNNLLLI